MKTAYKSLHYLCFWVAKSDEGCSQISQTDVKELVPQRAAMHPTEDQGSVVIL